MSPVKLKVSEFMNNRGLSVKDLSEQAHIAYGTALALKRGSMTRIDFETIEKLCTLFNCTPGDLIVKQN